MDGLIFGLVDNGVLLASAYIGALNVEKYFEGRGALGAIVGAGIGNAVSDGLGALVDPTLQSAVVGIVLGCLLPLTLIPVVEYFRGRTRANTTTTTTGETS